MKTTLTALKTLTLTLLLVLSSLSAASARAPIGGVVGDLDPVKVADPVFDPADRPVLEAPRDVVLPTRFLRGDADGNGQIELADSVTVLSNLFLGTKELGCVDAADANDDGQLAISDAVHTLGFLFLGGVRMPAPFPICGEDPTSDGLGCAQPSAACAPSIENAAFQITRVEDGYLIDLPREMIAAFPDESALALRDSGSRDRMATGVAQKISSTTLLLSSATAVQLGGGKLPVLQLEVPSQTVRMPALGFQCGPMVCTCSGDEDCNRLFSTDSCTGGFCVTDSAGNVWCICAARF